MNKDELSRVDKKLTLYLWSSGAIFFCLSFASELLIDYIVTWGVVRGMSIYALMFFLGTYINRTRLRLKADLADEIEQKINELKSYIRNIDKISNP